MGRIITPTLPHDLPENWTDNQYVSPGGTEVGLTRQHGFNYLMEQVNNAQRAINELDSNALSAGALFHMIASEPALLSTAGWYRLASFEGDFNTSVSALLFVGNNFYNGGASSILASVGLNAHAASVVVLDHTFTSIPIFDTLRFVRNDALQATYLDIRYTRKSENLVCSGLLTFSYNSRGTQTSRNFAPVTELSSGDVIILQQDLASVPNGSVLTTGSAVLPATLE